jgi:hypothetical protein
MSSAPQSPAGSPSSPPRIRRGPGRAIILVACGVLLALLLLIVVLNVEHPEQQAASSSTTDDIIELVQVPPALDPDDLSSRPRARLDSPDELAPVLEEGTWIQVANENGELAQQYRCQRLTPSPGDRPPGWVEREAPEAELYLADGRVVTLVGNHAIAYAPSRALESGTITGDVRIRLFEPGESGAIDVRRDQAALDVRTGEASFDNVSGELRCDGEVEIQTPQLFLPGHELRVLVDDQQNRFRLRIETVEYVRLVAADPAVASPAPDAPSTAVPPRSVPERRRETALATPATSAPPPAADARPGQDAPPAAQLRTPASTSEPSPGDPDSTLYLLTLSDDVRIVNGQEPQARIATDEALTILFTFQSEGFGDSLAAAGGDSVDGATARPARPGRAARTSTIRDDLALGAVADTQAPNDVTMITCAGPLTIEPVTDPARRLASPSDTLVTLSGPPVEILDQSSDSAVVCAELHYRSEAAPAGDMIETMELHGSPSFPLTIASPETSGRADWLWIRPSDGTGRLEGAGWMLWRESPLAAELRAAAKRGEAVPLAAPPGILDVVPPRQLRLTWERGVDLAFAAAGSERGLGPLESATFEGDVRALGDEFRLDADQLAARFAETDDGGQTIRGIHATGDVEAEGTGERTGLIACRELDLALVAGADGQPVPTRLEALGDVHANDVGQVIWTDYLDVTFLAPTESSDLAEATSPVGGDATVDRLLADGNVQIHLDDGSRVFADQLEADAAGRTAVLTGDGMMLVRDDSMIDRASRLEVEEPSGLYVLDGPGRLRVFDRPILAPGAARMSPPEVLAAVDRVEQLRVTWQQRAELEDHASATEPRSRLATFRGGIEVRSEELDLDDADRLVARFVTDDDGTATIDSLNAFGPAPEDAPESDDARGRAPLHITLRQREEAEPGATEPAPVAEQNLWAATVHATFIERVVAPGEDAPGETPDHADGIEMDTFNAREQVRIRLADGSILFADELRGRGPSRSADLFGAPVLVVSDNTVLTCEPKATLIDRDGEYELIGPGHLRMFDGPVELMDDDRPEPSSLARDPQLIAHWTDSAVYVQPRNDAFATIDLRGSVHVEAWPDPLELDRIDAESLTLEFDDPDRAPTSNNEGPSAGGMMDDASRRLARLIARGDAHLENVSWRRTEDRHDEDLARVFYVAGQHVLYDDRSGEALVAGDGELLIHDPWADEDEPPASDATNESSFSAKGTTLFRFSRKLEMMPAVDEVFDIVMSGDVEMLHRNLDTETATLTGDRLEARVERARGAGASGSFDFGGHATLQFIKGIGNIFIRTRTRDVRCDEFYYAMDRIAELKARSGRRVAVKTRGAGEALLAEHVLWNMDTDTISTRGVSGSGAQ